MSRLSGEEIQTIAKEKGLRVLNPEEYINLTSDNLVFECENGHHFNAKLKDVRDLASFGCYDCMKQQVKYVSQPPIKTGYRVVGFDQATQNFGVSVYDDGKLVYYDIVRFIGETDERLVNIADFVDKVCKNWTPDKIIFEDIQLHNNQYGGYHTFKVLAELLGVVKMVINKNKIPYDCVLNKVWQAKFNIGGKDRISQKLQVIDKVEKLFGIKVSDDIADAIMIGKYGVEQKKGNKNEKLF